MNYLKKKFFLNLINIEILLHLYNISDEKYLLQVDSSLKT